MSTESDRMIQDFCAAKQEGEAVRVRSFTWDMDYGYFDDRSDEWCPLYLFKDIVSANYFRLNTNTVLHRYDPNHRILLVWNSMPSGAYQVYQIYYHPAPDFGYEKLAYLGQANKMVWLYDREWDSGWDNDFAGPDETRPSYSKTIEDVLFWAMWDKERLLEIGLTCCEDYEFGSAGGTWLVRDKARCETALKRGIRSDEFSPFFNVEDKFLFLATGVESTPGVQTLENNPQNTSSVS